MEPRFGIHVLLTVFGVSLALEPLSTKDDRPAHCLTSRMQMDIRHRMMSSPSSKMPSRLSCPLMLSRTLAFSYAGTFVQFHSGCSLANRLASSLAKACSYADGSVPCHCVDYQGPTGTEVAAEKAGGRGFSAGNADRKGILT